MTEEYELWRRDLIQIIRQLIGNPALEKNMAYAPELVYADSKGTVRQYDEMWTADWWWNIQVFIYFPLLHFSLIMNLGEAFPKFNSCTSNCSN